MHTLFPELNIFPEGFQYFPDFLTTEEEQYLYHKILKVELHTFTFQGFEAKRRVESFGYDYHFDSRSITKGREIPEEFIFLIEKVSQHINVSVEKFAELLVTEYPLGSVINWHRDAPPFDLIAGISLMTDCTFRLRPYDKKKQGRNSIISFPVQRRSLYVMQGVARSEWEHSIRTVKQVRYSLTLRTLRESRKV